MAIALAPAEPIGTICRCSRLDTQLVSYEPPQRDVASRPVSGVDVAPTGELCVETFVTTLNGYVWSPPLVWLCLGAGLYFSVRTRFVQIRSSAR